MHCRWPFLLFAVAACGSDPEPTVYFELEDFSEPETFWNLPFPSDLRLTATGAPDLTGFPNPRDVPILRGLVSVVDDRRGWPTMPTAYFRFTQPIDPKDVTQVIEPGPDAPVMLIDIDPASPEFGTRFPIVAKTLAPDGYVPSDLVALAPRPGIVLRANTTYAYVIRRAFAPGFAAPSGFTALEDGRGPAAAVDLYAPLWRALDDWKIDDAIVATVFETGDEVARLHARSEAIRAAFSPVIENLTLVGGSTLDGFCQLSGTITMPQFQVGTQPFNTEGRFVVDADDVPQRQSDMVIPIAITIPKLPMPATGWPLYQFFHGSGGVSTGLVDLGYSPTPDDIPELGKGPGFVVARHGIAAVSAAMPVNPERLTNAGETEYLNINNLAAFPYTFQQGVLEQRLLTDAMVGLQIPVAALAGCGVPAPVGGNYIFDETKLVAGGQSMGGMYTNMVAAIEPRFGAVVPTGAGGFWNLMILETATVPGARDLLSTALGIDEREISFVHPALDVMALGWEIAEPMAYMARIARRPLPGFSARHIYEPVGKDDVYFPIAIYDAAALAYGNQQVGDELWPTMQLALAVDGLEGFATYPVSANIDGKTRVVVQYESDGLIDSHYIYRQLDAVKYQYGCFFATYLRDGVPTVPAPGALTDPCP